MNLAPFIKLGWHTVPLKGVLERLADGKKTLPEFEKGWRQKYTEEFNQKATALGGAITGQVSGIVAIDCDNTLTYELFKKMDPDYEFEFISLGKGEETCGTLVYLYDEEFQDCFKVADEHIKLDFYSNGGFVYLPTEANKTKVAWKGRLPTIKPMPEATRLLLRRLRVVNSPAPSIHRNIITTQCLAPLIEKFTNERKFMPGLFKIITPKDFRAEPQYVREGFLHPEQVPEGRGSEYLSKVSAILGKDPSISAELYSAAMHDINGLWPTPMDLDRLDATIIEPMLNGSASIDGEPIWRYDENWSQYRLILPTKRQSSIEIGFDDRRCMYYAVDEANATYQQFALDTNLVAYIGSVALNPPAKKDLKLGMPLLNVVSDPSRDFGFVEGSDPTARTLNTFLRTPELAIIAEPSTYANMYTYPENTMKFLELLVPEDKMRNFLLKFLKRKLRTFDYSPVVLYFLGVHGSGKDTFVAILEQIMGKVAKPTVREFLEMFNGWLLDTYFVQLDEYGNQLTTIRDRDEALGKLKAYTGKQTVQVRQMRTDGFSYHHNATFIMTANTNPFGIEDGDRRIALMGTPNKMTDHFDDVVSFRESVLSETKDFCYYLATQVEDIKGTDYVKPPESEHKQKLIADNMYAASRLAFVLKNGMRDYLHDLALDYGCKEVVDAMNKGRMRASDLQNLYDLMTDYKGEIRSLNKAMRLAGIETRVSSAPDGTSDTVYLVDWLSSPFEAD